MAIFLTYEEQQVLSSLEVLVNAPAGSQAFTGTLHWLKTNSQPGDLKGAMEKIRSKEALVPSGEKAEKAQAVHAAKQKQQRDAIMQRALAQTKVIARDYPDTADSGRDLPVSEKELAAAKQEIETVAAQKQESAKAVAESAAKAAAAELDAKQKSKQETKQAPKPEEKKKSRRQEKESGSSE